MVVSTTIVVFIFVIKILLSLGQQQIRLVWLSDK